MLHFWFGINSNNHKVENIQIALKYCEDKPGIIPGRIYGAPDKYHSFIEVVNNSTSEIKIYSKYPRDEIFCENIHFKKFGMMDRLDCVSEFATFEAYDFNHIHFYDKKRDKTVRNISFYISGPYSIFGIKDNYIKTENGSYTREFINKEFQIDDGLKVELVPKFFYEFKSDINISTKIVALHIQSSYTGKKRKQKIKMYFGVIP
jgi:hypothetical protein